MDQSPSSSGQVQMLIGFAVGAGITIFRGRRMVMLLEDHFSGFSRAVISLDLVALGFILMFLAAMVADQSIPVLPLVFMSGWITCTWAGGTTLIWMPFGGLSKASRRTTTDADAPGPRGTGPC